MRLTDLTEAERQFVAKNVPQLDAFSASSEWGELFLKWAQSEGKSDAGWYFQFFTVLRAYQSGTVPLTIGTAIDLSNRLADGIQLDWRTERGRAILSSRLETGEVKDTDVVPSSFFDGGIAALYRLFEDSWVDDFSKQVQTWRAEMLGDQEDKFYQSVVQDEMERQADAEMRTVDKATIDPKMLAAMQEPYGAGIDQQTLIGEVQRLERPALTEPAAVSVADPGSVEMYDDRWDVRKSYDPMTMPSLTGSADDDTTSHGMSGTEESDDEESGG